MTTKAITLDAYGTLFDIDAVGLTAVEAFVTDQKLSVDPPTLSELWTRKFFDLLHAYGDENPTPFRTIREMTTSSLRECFDELGAPEGKTGPAVEIWFEHVSRSPLYPEVREAVESLATRYDLALISDADDDVIGPTLRDARLPVGHVFTSETHRAYKIDVTRDIFHRAFAALGATPEEVVHVGDSSSDIVGAARAGARSVWLSRDGRAWKDERAAPTHTCRDMAEAARLLCGNGWEMEDGRQNAE